MGVSGTTLVMEMRRGLSAFFQQRVTVLGSKARAMAVAAGSSYRYASEAEKKASVGCAGRVALPPW